MYEHLVDAKGMVIGDEEMSGALSQNEYLFDSGNLAEIARLIDQDRVVTSSMGGPLAGLTDTSSIQNVLDLGCGPGGWGREVARISQRIKVVGIDLSNEMIAHAKAIAQTQGLANCQFQVMDMKKLDFETQKFDLINSRFLFAVMRPEEWVPLLRTCQPLLRPGGLIRLTEPEWAFTNSHNFERYGRLLAQALKKAGRSFSPDGFRIGIIPILGGLLEEAGYQLTNEQLSQIKFSARSHYHDSILEDCRIAMQQLQPFLETMQVATSEEISQIFKDALLEMQSASFQGMMCMMTVGGRWSSSSSL